MTDPAAPSPKTDPEALKLRARPRPVTRFNRKVLIVGAALGSAALFGATLVALHPPRFQTRQSADELYNPDRKHTAEGLPDLPRDSAALPTPPPTSGRPLPGDARPPDVGPERRLALPPQAPPAPG